MFTGFLTSFDTAKSTEARMGTQRFQERATQSGVSKTFLLYFHGIFIVFFGKHLLYTCVISVHCFFVSI